LATECCNTLSAAQSALSLAVRMAESNTTKKLPSAKSSTRTRHRRCLYQFTIPNTYSPWKPSEPLLPTPQLLGAPTAKARHKRSSSVSSVSMNLSTFCHDEEEILPRSYKDVPPFQRFWKKLKQDPAEPTSYAVPTNYVKSAQSSTTAREYRRSWQRT
jgi:hypothetical protein